MAHARLLCAARSCTPSFFDTVPWIHGVLPFLVAACEKKRRENFGALFKTRDPADVGGARKFLAPKSDIKAREKS